MKLESVSLQDKYTVERGRVYLTGTQALVRLPLLQKQLDRHAGLNTAGFVSGYRGSPLGGYDKALWEAREHLEAHDVVFQPGVNEDLAATAVWGTQQIGLFGTAQRDGVFGIWYGKGPGVDRSTDALKHANAAGTAQHGGVLALVGDDHACKSSTLPHQSEPVLIAAGIPVLNPANVREIIDYGLYGWALSRFSGLWVGLKIIAETADSSTSVDLGDDTVPTLPAGFAMPPGGLNIRWPDDPMTLHEPRLYDFKLPAARAFHRASGLDRTVVDAPRPRLGIAATGKAWLDLREALLDLGIDDARAAAMGLRLYKVAMPWPLEPEGARAFAAGLESVVVVEEKRGIIEEQLRNVLYDLPDGQRPRIVGKQDEQGNVLFPVVGELSPTLVARRLGERLGAIADSSALRERLAAIERIDDELRDYQAAALRTPYFCSGCPHNTSTRVPEGSRALAGIGCHYLAQGMDRRTDTFTQMGGEGASWIGQAPFVDDRHVFVNIGDGTYYHSGLLAIRAAVAAQVNATYKILFNDAVAMTGGQPVEGQLTVPDVVAQLVAEGVAPVVVVSENPKRYGRSGALPPGTEVLDRADLDVVQRRLREVTGVTAIVYDQTCATEKRRRRKRGSLADPKTRIFINDLVCEGCGDCSAQSNCLSVEPLETEFGRKRRINQSTCNKDTRCLDGFCPSFVTIEGADLRKPERIDPGDAIEALPEPPAADLGEPFGVLLTGVGGTGVVTVAELLGMAAHLEGKGVVVVNQTGLAQKYGAVTSHVRVGVTPAAVLAPRIADGKARLLLGCDLVVAASKDALAKLDRKAGHAVVNAALTPTAAFVRNPDQPEAGDALRRAIERVLGTERVRFVDASRLGAALLGDTIAANAFLLGHACQSGLLPVGPVALERAMELNGVAVALNLDAFRWGRLAAHDPASVAAVVEPPPPPLADDLESLVNRRAAFLVGYQNRAYAARYRDRIERLRQVEVRVLGTDDVATAAARGLFKLMAYKDEYEVARLWARTPFLDDVRRRFTGEAKVVFHLAPPVGGRRHPETGQPVKSRFGRWMLTAFRVLAHMKALRGSALDPFGWTDERRRERALIADYDATLGEIEERLSPATAGTALALARLPERIRGFGHVKARHLAEVEGEWTRLLATLRDDVSPAQVAAPSVAEVLG
ncbi:MAG: indolepyruvate ferredoxin oxidoreductase family protein [Pseudomonadota bacterium]